MIHNSWFKWKVTFLFFNNPQKSKCLFSIKVDVSTVTVLYCVIIHQLTQFITFDLDEILHYWFTPLTQYVNFGLNYCLLWNNFARAQCSKSSSRISTFFIGLWRNCSNRHINLTWPLLLFEIHILCRHCPYAFSSVRDLCLCTSHTHISILFITTERGHK